MVSIWKRLSGNNSSSPPPQQQGPAFVIQGLDDLPADSREGFKDLMDAVANECTRSIPALTLHQVFGANANRLTMVAGQPGIADSKDTLVVELGPKCGGGNCTGGKAGQQGTVDAIAKIISRRPEVKLGQMDFAIYDIQGNQLTPG